jgi:hypothetical protein
LPIFVCGGCGAVAEDTGVELNHACSGGGEIVRFVPASVPGRDAVERVARAIPSHSHISPGRWVDSNEVQRDRRRELARVLVAALGAVEEKGGEAS